jgi:hypothetical protein
VHIIKKTNHQPLSWGETPQTPRARFAWAPSYVVVVVNESAAGCLRTSYEPAFLRTPQTPGLASLGPSYVMVNESAARFAFGPSYEPAFLRETPQTPRARFARAFVCDG